METNAPESRARILQEATRLFMEDGYHHMSMRRLAERAELSKAGIYHHFKDKESLFVAVLRKYLDCLEQLIIEAEQRPGQVQDKVSAVVEAILGQSPVQRAIIRVASQEMGQLSQSSRDTFKETYHRQFIGRIAALLARGIEAGEFSPADPMILTWALLGLMYPYFYAAHNDYIGATKETIGQLLDIFFNGVLA